MKISDIENIEDEMLHAVVTIGMFDGVHVGHRAILEELKTKASKCNATPVVITFDAHPRIVLNYESSRLRFLSTQNEKFGLLEKYGINNILLIHFTPEFAKLPATDFVQQYLIDKLNIKGLVLGYDNHFGNKKHDDFDNIEQLAKKADFFISTVEACSCNNTVISSTQIRNKIENSDIDLANKMLGYDYFFSGTVVHGYEIGRKLGFPTANISLSEPKKVIPEQGVYVVAVQIDVLSFGAVLNIGKRPTLGFEGETTIEVHIFDFSENIYGKEITITIIEKIRDERKFDNMEKLTAQIALDKEKALAFFDRFQQKTH